MGGFFAADGISTITGTSLMYGGGGGGGVAWFNELTHSVVKGLGGGVGGDGGFYITNPSAAPDNSFNPVASMILERVLVTMAIQFQVDGDPSLT